MILNLLMNLLMGFMGGIINLLGQAGSVPANNALTEAVTTAAGYYVTFSPFLPMTLLLAANLLILQFDGAYLFYKLVRWAYRKIPGVS